MGLVAARIWGGGDRGLLTGQVEDAARLLSGIGDDTGVGIAFDVHSSLAWHWGDYELAHTKGCQAVARFEAAGHQTMIAQGWRVAGLAAALDGDVDGGRRLVRDGVALSDRLGDLGGLPLGLCMLGLVEDLGGCPEGAAAAFARSLRLNREEGQVWPAVVSLAFAGARAALGDRPADGVRLLAASRQLTKQTGIGLAPRERAGEAEALRRVGGLLGPDEVAAAEEDGRQLGAATAMVLALAVLEGSRGPGDWRTPPSRVFGR